MRMKSLIGVMGALCFATLNVGAGGSIAGRVYNAGQ